MSFTKCPKCGESPVQIDGAAPEAIRTGVAEFLPEPVLVERLRCQHGHEWFDWEEKDERAED
jgi:hypothetical protein